MKNILVGLPVALPGREKEPIVFVTRWNLGQMVSILSVTITQKPGICSKTTIRPGLRLGK